MRLARGDERGEGNSAAVSDQVELGSPPASAAAQRVVFGLFPGVFLGAPAAEREARRPEPKPDTKGEVARARLRSAPSISLADVPAGEEFALVVTRRGPDGTHEPVAIVADEALVERAIRRAV